ncbi:MAG: hypothetical protein HQ534_08940 [Armatimonadetes bacterium]|nr:hypothetical protein [Armatimonadota bacterium]
MEYQIYNIFFAGSNIANCQASVSSSSKEKAESVLEKHLLDSKARFSIDKISRINLTRYKSDKEGVISQGWYDPKDHTLIP